MSEISYRPATADDVEEMKRFIFEQGQHEHNYLPEKPVKRGIDKIKKGKRFAVVAEADGQMVGFATFWVDRSTYRRYDRGWKEKIAKRGYIDEVVVHRRYHGKRIGPTMLEKATAEIAKTGAGKVYIHRDHKNEASAAMMKKAGFSVVHSFRDKKMRSRGSGFTTVCRRILK